MPLPLKGLADAAAGGASYAELEYEGPPVGGL